MNNTIKTNTQGYFNDVHWWFNIQNEDSFSIFDLDHFYEETYFREDHLSTNVILSMIDKISTFHKNITSKDIGSLLEIGCGGGWITSELVKNSYEVKAIEGSLVGYNKCLDKGLANIVIKHDLRKPILLNKKYDISICTEVAEHIEPPFSSVLISNITNNSKMVWFSFNKSDAHHHHSNLQPDKFWINLFKFYGWDYLVPNPQYKSMFNHRLDFIFYDTNEFGILDKNLIYNE